MNPEDNRDYTFRYSMIPLFYWGAFCSVVSYASYYLLSIGYKNSTIGMIIALAGIFSAVLQPMIAGYADRTDSPSLKKILLVVVGLEGITYLLMFLVHQRIFALSGVLYAVGIGIHQIVTPLVNSLGTETLNQKKKLNYGVSRAMGSVGYAIVAFILGRITVKADSSSVLIATLLILFFMELFLLLYPFQKQVRTAAPDVQNTKKSGMNSSGNALAFFRHYRRFSILLIGCILIYISHVLINNFTLQIVTSKGGGTAEMGTAQGIASLIELPTMFLFGWFLTKAPAAVWFKISGFFFFIKTFATMLAPNIAVFYGVQIFQMFGWALITVSSVYYINSIMEEQDKIKGQAYFTMTYTIGCVFGSLLGGTLLEHFSATAMMGCGSVCGFLGAVIIFLMA